MPSTFDILAYQYAASWDEDVKKGTMIACRRVRNERRHSTTVAKSESLLRDNSVRCWVKMPPNYKRFPRGVRSEIRRIPCARMKARDECWRRSSLSIRGAVGHGRINNLLGSMSGTSRYYVTCVTETRGRNQ